LKAHQFGALMENARLSRRAPGWMRLFYPLPRRRIWRGSVSRKERFGGPTTVVAVERGDGHPPGRGLVEVALERLARNSGIGYEDTRCRGVLQRKR